MIKILNEWKLKDVWSANAMRLVLMLWVMPDVNSLYMFTAHFNNMRTLKFRRRPTNASFADVYQMFGGSSQLTTTAEHYFVVWTVHDDLITACAQQYLEAGRAAFVGRPLNFRVCMLL